MCFSSSTTVSTACSIPRFSPIGFAPAVTFLRPPRKMAWARTVAVVVPSPAMSEVLDATSLSIWAPMFSQGSLSSISLATATPSLVMVGLPNFLSRTTFRPFGPRVTLTAWAMTLTPRRSDARASSLNRSFLAMNRSFQVVQPIDGGRGNHLGAENAEDVLFLHDQVLLAVQRDLASGVLAEQHAIAGLDIQGSLLAVLADRAFADGEDLALLGLLLGAVRDDEAAAANLLFLDPLDQDAVVERVQGGLQGLGHGADTSSFRCV